MRKDGSDLPEEVVMEDESRARLERTFAAIDEANAGDPNRIEVRGRTGPREVAHANLACEWVRTLEANPSDALLLAARAHHLRRWEIPRSDHPAGRSGYLRWRKALQAFHAQEAAAILRRAGWDEDIVARVGDLIRKRNLGRDPEVQVFEDALCLTFLETQLVAFVDSRPEDRAEDVLRKTIRKMSPKARRLALELPLPPTARELIRSAQAPSRD